ncbi:caspase-2-like [Actinia tenebrosa]|uniref:Caspase-2-like n=1 Tax=Actinia tenebrosa TaxID=6105 RepID=A0A6P8HM59_ACTTE|nr:caspase-2-like [Actinia tenebrosa]
MIPVNNNERFQVKDKVIIHLDPNDLHQIIKTKYGHWDDDLERGIFEVGIVENDDDNGVEVKYETLKEALLFPHDVLSKVHDLRVKDRATISVYKEKVKILQEGHRGWIDQMEEVLGQEGIVTEIDEKGDANVEVGETKLWFNPAALILESKEEEREPAGTVMTDDAKEGAEGGDGTLAVTEKRVKKSLPEEALETLEALPDLFKNRIEGLSNFITEGFKKFREDTRKKLPITVIFGDNQVDSCKSDQSNNAEEIDSLEGQACAPLQSAESTEELKSSDEDEDEDFFVRPTIMRRIAPENQPHRTDNVYEMTLYPRGVAMIVNIKNFTIDPGHPMFGKLEERLGSEKDQENFTLLFEYLGFLVETINRTSGDELLAELHRISTEYDFSTTDCFVLCIMSHGENDSIYASDGKRLPPSLIVSLFWNSRCKSLAGKPKLFFFQGCRGKRKDRGVPLSDVPGDEMKTAINDSFPSTSESNDASTIPETADILEFYSCYVGFNAFRNSETGSPFIQTIVEVFRKYACRHHILELITKVKKRVSESQHLGKKQMPQHNSTLLKYLYFWPGIDFWDEYPKY